MNAAPTKTTEALTQTLRALVARPDCLDVAPSTAGSSTLYVIRTSYADDQPRLVGRSGHNVQALRTLLSAMATTGSPCRLHLEEPGHTITRPAAEPLAPDALLRLIVAACPRDLPGARVDATRSPDGKTWTVALCTTREIVPALRAALETLFRAIGKRQEISLYLDIQANVSPAAAA